MSPQPSLDPVEREELLEEIRSYLPAFLEQGASEQTDPAGDVRALLDLDQRDLDRVLAVHGSLDERVLRLGYALEEGLRQPLLSSASVAVVRQDVRGQLDWPRTLRHRAQAPGDVASYAVHERNRAVDSPEGRALAWLLSELESMVARAGVRLAKGLPEKGIELGWAQKVELLRRQLARGGEEPWLRHLRPQAPTPHTLRGLRASRSAFYGGKVVEAIESVQRLSRPSPEVLTEVLAERYFRPGHDGALFEVAVALRVARAFAERSPKRRRTRLLVGEGKSTFARYGYEGDVEIRLAYQTWPDRGESMRVRLNRRHGMKSAQSGRPDIIIARVGSGADAVVLELKASSNRETIRKGLGELLAYLADRPDLWGPAPAGWLVAPKSSAFNAAPPAEGLPLWIVSAAEVGEAAVTRFLRPVGSSS